MHGPMGIKQVCVVEAISIKQLMFSDIQKKRKVLRKVFTKENGEIEWKIGNKSLVKKRDQVARRAQKCREGEIVT